MRRHETLETRLGLVVCTALPLPRIQVSGTRGCHRRNNRRDEECSGDEDGTGFQFLDEVDAPLDFLIIVL